MRWRTKIIHLQESIMCWVNAFTCKPRHDSSPWTQLKLLCIKAFRKMYQVLSALINQIKFIYHTNYIRMYSSLRWRRKRCLMERTGQPDAFTGLGEVSWFVRVRQLVHLCSNMLIAGVEIFDHGDCGLIAILKIWWKYSPNSILPVVGREVCLITLIKNGRFILLSS